MSYCEWTQGPKTSAPPAGAALRGFGLALMLVNKIPIGVSAVLDAECLLAGQKDSVFSKEPTAWHKEQLRKSAPKATSLSLSLSQPRGLPRAHLVNRHGLCQAEEGVACSKVSELSSMTANAHR